MSDNVRKEILDEIDKRLLRLKEHQNDKIIQTGNQYDELNQALSKVIGAPLIKELEDLKEFVIKL